MFLEQAGIVDELHGTNPEVVDRSSDKWPPYHALVDVDPPGGEGVADHEGVAQRFEYHIIVVLSLLVLLYLLAM